MILAVRISGSMGLEQIISAIAAMMIFAVLDTGGARCEDKTFEYGNWTLTKTINHPILFGDDVHLYLTHAEYIDGIRQSLIFSCPPQNLTIWPQDRFVNGMKITCVYFSHEPGDIGLNPEMTRETWHVFGERNDVADDPKRYLQTDDVKNIVDTAEYIEDSDHADIDVALMFAGDEHGKATSVRGNLLFMIISSDGFSQAFRIFRGECIKAGGKF